jgi:hypothetical protein
VIVSPCFNEPPGIAQGYLVGVVVFVPRFRVEAFVGAPIVVAVIVVLLLMAAMSDSRHE